MKCDGGAMCLECDKFVKTSNNTTNLHSHIQHNHSSIQIALCQTNKKQAKQHKSLKSKDQLPDPLAPAEPALEEKIFLTKSVRSWILKLKK